MTYEEALKILDTIPTIGEQVDALEMAIEALERQMPKDIDQGYVYDFHNPKKKVYYMNCPECEESIENEYWEYCPWCGQKLRRMEENDG